MVATLDNGTVGLSGQGRANAEDGNINISARLDAGDSKRWPTTRRVATAMNLCRVPSRASKIMSQTQRWQALAVMFLLLLVSPVHAVLIDFQNCLPASVLNSHPQTLQFMPNYTDVSFDTANPTHTVNVTIYGNVAGSLFAEPLPPPNSSQWQDPAFMDGKIADTYNNTQSDGSIKAGRTTLISTFRVLTYVPAAPPPAAFCSFTRSGTQCPVAPDFKALPYTDDPAEPYQDLPAFGVSHDMDSSFRFATLDTTFTINSGFTNGNEPRVIGCVSANITPDLGPSLRGMLRFFPMAILIVVAVSTISAAILSPWGTTDPFKWTSNYGRDEDLLRLVTPGFGDCLQYIQFIFLSGALSLSYPGYFRPVVSQVNWSALMFNESFVSNGPPVQNPIDGIYSTRAYTRNGLDLISNSNYGMSQLRQLTGMSEDQDIWAGTVVWTLVIIGIVIVVCEAGFFIRYVLRSLADRPEEDLRSKNWPLTGGCIVRIVCNFFLLPLVALSFFQLVIAGRTVGGSSPNAGVVAAAVILLVAILVFAGWILRVIFAAKPRSILFDDLPTVLLWGPLYNTYSDDAAAFALIPALVTFVRAIAFGAVQPSGIVQIVILAICEVVLILTLQAFRPFRKQTSMNLYHTSFATVRLIVILLSITFTPSLGVTEPAKGWVGYAILLMHAIVLVFGFFLNSIQTLIEVIARYTGAGADEHTGAATRGAFVKVFGKRQLSRRNRRPGFRSSMTSDAAILTDDHDAFDNKSGGFGGRSRSISASSAILLNQRTPDRMSTHLDRTESGSGDLDRSVDTNPFSFLTENDRAAVSHRPGVTLRSNEGQGFYRQPRQRRPTGDLMNPGAQSRNSRGSGDWANNVSGESPTNIPDKRNSNAAAYNLSPDGNSKGAPAPAYMRQREGSDPVLNRDSHPAQRTNVDYAVREVDFYYGVRGPALSNQPTRKLRTGPADPVGPASSAAGWFRNMFGGKRKDSGGKGFEVVRSTRAPQRFTDESEPDAFQEPYHDSPDRDVPPAVIPGQRTRSNEEDRNLQPFPGQPEPRGTEDSRPVSSLSDYPDNDNDPDSLRANRVSELAPSIEPLDVGSSIHLPTRFNSQSTAAGGPYSQHPSRQPSSRYPSDQLSTAPWGRFPDHPSQPSRHPSHRYPESPSSSYSPIVPQRSSRRASRENLRGFDGNFLGVQETIPERHSLSHGRNPSSASQTGRVPFSTPLSPVDREHRGSLGAESALDFGRRVSHEGVEAPRGLDDDPRHPSVGYVNQFRASDALTQSDDGIIGGAGQAAEVIGRGNSRRDNADAPGRAM
ncbi:MAG: hypothetical protein Q9159_002441 [Coniocarpon cinnabarinum]